MPVSDTADPLFPSTLREWRTKRRLSVRALAERAHHGKSLVHDLETGRRTPTRDIAARLDDALDAGGSLACLVTSADEPTDRLSYAAAHPDRVDAATVDVLDNRLAEHRSLEDTVGAAAMLPAARTNLATVEALLRGAHGALRPRLVCTAAQWAQFVGWLHLARGRLRHGTATLDRALEWAVEAGDRDLVATVLSFKGHAAWLGRDVGPLIGLTEAALRDRGIYIGQRAYDEYQLARGLTLAGDTKAANEALAVGVDLAAEAAEDHGDRPPWHYYRSAAFFALEAGLVRHLLGDHDRAAQLLADGLAGLPADMRDAEWTGPYREALAAAEAGMSADPSRTS